MYDLPGSAAEKVWLVCYAQLCNEGSSTAVVTLPAYCVEVDAPETRPKEGTNAWCTQVQGQPQQIDLAPGARTWVLLQAPRTVGDWARLHDRWNGAVPVSDDKPVKAHDVPGVRFRLLVQDQFAEGVEDVTDMDLFCHPLEPVSGSGSRWRVRPVHSSITGQPLVRDVVGPTRRRYTPAHLRWPHRWQARWPH